MAKINNPVILLPMATATTPPITFSDSFKPPPGDMLFLFIISPYGATLLVIYNREPLRGELPSDPTLRLWNLWSRKLYNLI